LKLKDVRGPLPWADHRVSACAGEWVDGDPTNPTGGSVCEVFNACTAGGVTPPSADAHVCGATTSTGGAGGAPSAGAPSSDGGGAGTSSGGRGGVPNAGATNGGANQSGAGGATSSSGGGSPSFGGAANAGQGGSSSPPSGCGCELARRTDTHEGWSLALLALGTLWRRKRDERKSKAKAHR
jgi:hypothetical protein